MHLLFITYHHLDSNSGIHIFNLANHLAKMGMDCTVCVPDHPEKTKALGRALFETVDYMAARHGNTHADIDLIHAWTPREKVRRITEFMVKQTGCPYMVHLEDNEEYLTEMYTYIPFGILDHFPDWILDRVTPKGLSHPHKYRQFINGAAGVSTIIDRLIDFVPPAIPKVTIWAGYEEELEWNRPTDVDFRRHLGIKPAETVIAYTGNLHKANIRDTFWLCEAILLMHRQGRRIKLVFTGEEFINFARLYNSLAGAKIFINLGHVPRKELPRILSVADILVQPGRADRFNNFRFPSKLPEYFASGKPVILPKANIGRYLQDGIECLLLKQGNDLDIAEKIEQLIDHPDLCEAIGGSGRNFARENLTWEQQARKLFEFYQAHFF